MTDQCVDEILTYFIIALQNTPLASKSLDITSIRDKVQPVIDTVLKKLDTKDFPTILKFVKNQSLINACILPNIAQIMQDGKIAIDDAPAFLNIMVGVFASVKEFVAENPTVSITSNDIIELSALITKVVISILVQDPNMVMLANSLIDSSIKLVKLVVKTKTCSCKLICCKK